MSPSKYSILAAKTKKRVAKEAKVQVFKKRNAGNSEIREISSFSDVLEEDHLPKCKRRFAEDAEAKWRSKKATS